MKPLKTVVLGLGTVGALMGLTTQVLADAKPNPYLAIIERNPFGLKDPPPPTPPPQEKPAVPPAKVILTGITSLFGPASKRCFLEITEQEPGKPGTVNRPILREGEQAGSVEVVSIDLEKNLVHIRNSGQELDLKFEDPTKTASSAVPRPVVPGIPAAPTYQPPPAAMNSGAPTIISPSSADNSSRNSSVSMFGGQNSFAASGSANVAPAGSIPSPLGSATGGPAIITRALRGQAQEGSPDPAVQYATALLQTQHYQSQGIQMPPMLPMPGISEQEHNASVGFPPAQPQPQPRTRTR
jgi:hypothetical protein